MSKIKKILIIRLGAIGDVINTSVIASSIKAKHPDVVIHYLTLDFIAPLLKNNPDIDRVLTVCDRRKKNPLHLIKIGFVLLFQKYDAIINLSNTIRNSIFTFLSGVKNVVKRQKAPGHAAEVFFQSAKSLFDDVEMPKSVKLCPDPEIKNRIKSRIENYAKPYLVLNPGGANDKDRQGRIWVDKYWIELGNKLVETYGGTVFITGSKSERENHLKYSEIKNSVIFSGELSLAESAALFSICDLFISGDSGPLHMAAGVGVRTLGIMGSTTGQGCGPYSPNGSYITPVYKCAGCGMTKCPELKEGAVYTPCISTITPDMVLNKIKENNILSDFTTIQ